MPRTFLLKPHQSWENSHGNIITAGDSPRPIEIPDSELHLVAKRRHLLDGEVLEAPKKAKKKSSKKKASKKKAD